MPITLSTHILMILFVGGIILTILYLGKKSKTQEKSELLGRRMGIGLLSLWVIYNIYYFIPANFKWEVSLPLHVCDILAPVAAIALISKNRLARSFLYFSAIALATQAIITPTGNQNPATWRFWLYWSLHAGILASAIFDLVIRRYRPRPKDLLAVVLLDIGYLLVMVPINLHFGWNYGYVGNSIPDGATLINVLGPWPQRIFLIVLIAISIQGLILLPWVSFKKRSVEI